MGGWAPAVGASACRGSTPGRWPVSWLSACRSWPGPPGAGSSCWPSPTVTPAARVAAISLCCATGRRGVGAAGPLGAHRAASTAGGAWRLRALGAAARASGQWSVVSGSEGLHCRSRPCASRRWRASTWRRPCPRARGLRGLQDRGLSLSPTFPAARTAWGRVLRVGGPGHAGGGRAVGPRPPPRVCSLGSEAQPAGRGAM